MEIIVRRRVPTADLAKADFCGVTYDGGRTCLPWAAWWSGQIVAWKPTRKEAETEYRKERRREVKKSLGHKTRS